MGILSSIVLGPCRSILLQSCLPGQVLLGYDAVADRVSELVQNVLLAARPFWERPSVTARDLPSSRHSSAQMTRASSQLTGTCPSPTCKVATAPAISTP